MATPVGNRTRQGFGPASVSNTTGTGPQPVRTSRIFVGSGTSAGVVAANFFPVLAYHPPDDDAGATAGARRLIGIWVNRRRLRVGVSAWLGPITGLPPDSGAVPGVGFGLAPFGLTPFGLAGGGVVGNVQLAVMPSGVTPSGGDWVSPLYRNGRPGYLFDHPAKGAYGMWALVGTSGVPAVQFATVNVV